MKPPRVLLLPLAETLAIRSQHQKCVLLIPDDVAEVGDIFEIQSVDLCLPTVLRLATHVQDVHSVCAICRVYSVRPLSSFEQGRYRQRKDEQAATWATANGVAPEAQANE